MAKKSEKNSKTISLATLIAIFSMAVFAILTYLGLRFKHSMGTSISYTALYCAILTILLVGIVKVKQVESDFTKWRIVEVLLFIMFVASAVYSSQYMIKAISVNLEKKELSAKGKKDIESVKEMFNIYEQKEKGFLDEERLSLNLTSGVGTTPALDDYLELVEANGGVDDFCELVDGIFLGEDGCINYKTFKEQEIKKLYEQSNIISNWNIVDLPSFASKVEKISGNICESLTKISKQRNQNYEDIPWKFKVKYNSETGICDIDQAYSSKMEFDYASEKPQLEFKNAIDNVSSPVAIALTVLLFIGMAVQYFAGYRSSTVEIRKRSRSSKDDYAEDQDGGINLYD